MGEVTSLFYCERCKQRRFAVAIMTCSVCGRPDVRCPQYQFKEWAKCESCAAKHGKCARCGEPRWPAKPKTRPRNRL